MSAARTYRDLWRERVCGLLGAWVSGLEPIIFTRVDVSPQVLAIVGIGADPAGTPQLSAEITVDDMIAAGALA